MSDHTLLALGLMTGTSADGLDICLASIRLSETEFQFDIVDSATTQFPENLRQSILDSPAGDANHSAKLHFRLGQYYAAETERFLADRVVDIAGVHGQTVAHNDGAYTLQLGSVALLAQQLKAPVITGFREADIAAGGNGAPLMPFLDWLLLRGENNCQATLNIGGIANITIVPEDGKRAGVIGYDTGPGMSLIDMAAQLWFDDTLDRDARYSRDGQLQPELLAWLMDHPYIKTEPPKSTGRDIFGRELLADLRSRFNLRSQDIIRTLVSFTAKSIAYNLEQSIKFSGPVNRLLVSGGGLKHPLLMSELKQILPGMAISSSSDIGVDPDIKEALLMAVLAVAYKQNMAGNMPGVTGAKRALVLGYGTG